MWSRVGAAGEPLEDLRPEERRRTHELRGPGMRPRAGLTAGGLGIFARVDEEAEGFIVLQSFAEWLSERQTDFYKIPGPAHRGRRRAD